MYSKHLNMRIITKTPDAMPNMLYYLWDTVSNKVYLPHAPYKHYSIILYKNDYY